MPAQPELQVPEPERLQAPEQVQLQEPERLQVPEQVQLQAPEQAQRPAASRLPEQARVRPQVPEPVQPVLTSLPEHLQARRGAAATAGSTTQPRRPR